MFYAGNAPRSDRLDRLRLHIGYSIRETVQTAKAQWMLVYICSFFQGVWLGIFLF